MKLASILALMLVCVCCLMGSKCMGDTPVELCYSHPVYGAVCVKVNDKTYDIDRNDLTPEQQKEVRAWLATQPK